MVQQPEVEWPTCEQAGCIGIRLASARACLAHASQEETANALKLVGDTGAIDVRGVLITDALLKRILTAAPLGENEEPLIKSCRFDRTTFTGDAEFDGATFTGDAKFDGAIFKRDARFDGVRFEHARQFGPLLAYRGLALDDVEFAQPVQVEVSTIGVCCRRARFAGGVQFRLRWACVVLDDTDLAAPSILAGIPRLSSDELARREERIAQLW